MQVKYDRKLLIAIGRSRKAAQWQNKEMLWSKFLDKLASTTRTRETVAEYAALPKGERDTVKDVGGFVGGYVLGDCVDRNPFGLKILKELYLMSNATVLLGNHEYMMLDALTKASPETNTSGAGTATVAILRMRVCCTAPKRIVRKCSASSGHCPSILKSAAAIRIICSFTAGRWDTGTDTTIPCEIPSGCGWMKRLRSRRGKP